MLAADHPPPAKERWSRDECGESSTAVGQGGNHVQTLDRSQHQYILSQRHCQLHLHLPYPRHPKGQISSQADDQIPPDHPILPKQAQSTSQVQQTWHGNATSSQSDPLGPHNGSQLPCTIVPFVDTSSRRNVALFSTTALLSSFLAVRWRQDEERKRNAETFHVTPARSGSS